MKELFVFIGIPNSGQEKFIKKHKIKDFTLSPKDNIPEYNIYGKIFYKMNFEEMYIKLEERMNFGQTVFVNHHNCSIQDIKPYINLAKKYFYKITLIRFPNKNTKDKEYTKKQLLSYTKKLNNFKHNLNEINYLGFEDYVKIKKQDFSKYHNIYFFGDIQGCFKPLRLFFKHHKENNNNLYIFLGDYINKGKENHKVVNWLLSKMNNKNFIFIEGNHERYLKNWSNGDNSEPEKFKKTKKQLEDFFVDKKLVKEFCDKLIPMQIFKYKEKEILISHSGFPFFPNQTHLIPHNQIVKGVGNRYHNIDNLFTIQSQEFQYQVHGHRNPKSLPIKNGRSFNLEGKVEFGGELRIIRLNKNGFKEIPILSNF